MFPLYIDLYLLMLFVPAFFGAVFGVIPVRGMKHVSMILCGISCIAGMFSYVMFFYYGTITYTLPLPSAWGDYSIFIDRLSALIMSASSIVYLMTVVHIAKSRAAPKYPMYNALLSLLFIACILAMCADGLLLLLIAWETITLTTFLMAYSGNDDTPRWKFFIITHLGGLMVVAAFILMYAFAGSTTLSSWHNLNALMGNGMASASILLLFMGFGSKLGLVPLHAWMPDLYADTPTHTDSLMATVCSSVAVLILFKGVFTYIGVTPDMYILAILLIAIASITVLWGALESLIQKEPKRILAYSSMENMGLVVLCFSLAMLFMTAGANALVTFAIVAGIFHTINHAGFKSLMLLIVATIEDSTGEKAIEKMGGLAKAMPFFSVLALIAVMSMAAIPPFSGFASEWLMIQSVMGGEFLGVQEIMFVLPLGVAVLGVGGMMAAVSYARMYGFIFSGRPRSESVANPEKPARITYVPMIILAAFCFVLGIMSYYIIGGIATGIFEVTGLPASDAVTDHMLSTLDIPLLAGLLVLTVVITYFLLRTSEKNTETSTTWDCGTPLESNMQYSSIGFTQPLVRVFHPLYGDSVEIAEGEHHEKKFTVKFREPFVKHLYDPVGKGVMKISRLVGKMQNGNVQTYLGYILVTLLALLFIGGVV